MAAQTTIEIEIHSPSVCLVTLRGEHDASSSEAVTLALAVARGYGNILVDLAACTFVDSTVINALLAAAKRARQLDGTLELVVPAESNPVRRALEIANVQMVMPFHASRAAGIAGIEARKRRVARGRADLRAVGAKIDRLQAKTEALRTISKRGEGLVIRAQVVSDGPSVKSWDEQQAA